LSIRNSNKTNKIEYNSKHIYYKTYKGTGARTKQSLTAVSIVRASDSTEEKQIKQYRVSFEVLLNI